MSLVGVVVRRYIDILIIIINFPYSTCIRSFFGSSILTSLFIFKCFFGLYIYRQCVGIPMGTDCAPLLANLFLFFYEYSYMRDLIKTDLVLAKNSKIY